MGDYIVDLHQRNDVTYYAICKGDCNDLVSIGHETSYAEAEQSARWTVTQLPHPEGFEVLVRTN